MVDGCIYGEVTAKLVDENGSTLVDTATGETPSHTFYPNSETEFTFRNYKNQMILWVKIIQLRLM